MQISENKKKKNINSVTSLVVGNTLYELFYDPIASLTKIARWKDSRIEVQASFYLNKKNKIIPYNPENPLIKHKIILFPASIDEYCDKKNLITKIREFIHRYVDISESFELVSTYYVLLTWIYDTFDVVPYLRMCGDYGSGKTRFLQTIGSICYKPIFASGASTVAPIFHILDQIGGTLILDEGDYRFSDEKADIAKILNNGNAKGFPVLRCEKINQGEFMPKAYQVFGPKIISSRNNYEDLAVESRFITEEVGWRKIREDIPLALPASFHEEAARLRNMLLMWRFHNFSKVRKPEDYIDPSLENRINQIFSPLLCLVNSEDDRNKILNLARGKNEQMRSDRGLQVEADVLWAIKEGCKQSDKLLSISEITHLFMKKFASAYDNRITPKWIGSILRRKLRLSTRKSNGVYVLCENQKEKLAMLYKKFDIGS